MFQNSKTEYISFDSCWKTDKSLTESSTQTSDISTSSKMNQASSSSDVEVQTEVTETAQTQGLSEEAEIRLATFLKRIEPDVLKELDRVTKSNDLLKSLEAGLEDLREEAECLHTLRATEKIVPSQQVNCLSWSCTGSVVAVGLGIAVHKDWCNHDSSIHLYNIDRKDLDSTHPSEILESPSCITTLRHHPTAPSLLAAGTFSGELLIWNGDSQQPTRTAAEEGHTEAVSQIHWLRTEKSSVVEEHTLITSGLDGRLLVWTLQGSKGPVKLKHSFEISCKHLPTPPLSTTAEDLQPITCLDVISRSEGNLGILGTQAGCLVLCSLLDPSKDDPVVSKFKGHEGSVTSVSCSPRSPQIFASCGSDQEIHIYRVKQESPLRILHCSRACVGAVWGGEGAVLAWWGGGCEAEVLALQGREVLHRQVATLEPKTLESTPPGHSTALAFNRTIPKLVAVGDTASCVRIWKVPLQ